MILIIDHYDSFIFNIIDIVGQYGHDVHHAFYDRITIKEIETLDPTHMILSPGPKHPDDASETMEFIRYFGKKHIPILGICLGHQLIGRAYGAKIEKNTPAHGISHEIAHDAMGIFQDIPPHIRVGRYHALSVAKENLPKVLHIKATHNQDIIMALGHEEYPIYGVQFHPESILTENGKEIILNFLNI